MIRLNSKKDESENFDLLKLSILKSKTLQLKSEVKTSDNMITDSIIMSVIKDVDKTIPIDTACNHISHRLRDYFCELDSCCDTTFNLISKMIRENKIRNDEVYEFIDMSHKNLYQCCENCTDEVQRIVTSYDDTFKGLMDLFTDNPVQMTEKIIKIHDELLNIMKR